MDGYVQIGTKLDTKDFDAEIKYVESQLEEIEYKLKQADMGFEVGDTEKLEAQYSRLSKQLDKLNQKQADLNKTDLSGIQKNIDKIGNSVSKTIKKVGRWALAIFGIRTAYNAVRSAISTLSQYNDQIADDIEYMQFALASMLQPIAEALIQIAYKLLTYVNYIAKAWFNVDLFANASADAMNKSAKSAEKMKKSLAGFDEMNVISDTSTSNKSDLVTPSFDLTAPENVPIPSWIQWIADNGNLIKDIIIGIGIAIASLKLADLLQTLGLFSNLSFWQLVGGLALIIGGIALAIQGVIDFIKDPSWENFLTILEGIALTVAGIAILMGGWIVALVALGVAIVAYIIQNWDKVKEILGKVWDWIKEHIIDPIAEGFSKLWEKIKEIFEPVIEFFKSIFGTVFENIKITLDNIKKIFSALWEGIKIIFGPFVQGLIDGFKAAWTGIKLVFSPFINFFSDLFSKVGNKLKEWGGKVGDIIGGAFKTVINGVLSAIENILNFPIKSINKLINVINKVPGINLGTLSTFSLPRLAVGGIVNMPGRGVPIGRAIAGEARAEGVIPLTDSQAMETLGQTIGRYITINASITNTMNGRIISRELQKINTSNDFARNV